ncbi:Methyltransferase domain-containing protein [Ekhidna lutea]|uniref:Methyltransferase domain-containing protein n=1 Tax=Ekhidna lutea TaxID=447679 RepID=A0A239JAY1_EKHLU|nr:class I SAM-dependent methyltransferase [Ekhidna lutea]SNT01794.1 Methyltransferase domain-containing protein [Ekhidna lutea]
MSTELIKDGKESEQLESVRDFFDGHASEYKKKYEKKNIFYEYFFYERLAKATDGVEFTGKSILDVGAGTGPLYDYLQTKKWNDFTKYTATDISSEMLKKSHIPEEQQLAGDFLKLKFEEKYDLIYMLGVTTYLRKDQMQQYLSKISSLLNEEGLFIVSFTNKNSLDILIRRLVRPFVRLFAGKNRVLSQDFTSSYYSKKECINLIEDQFNTREIIGLNHTFFPLSRIVPGVSIKIATAISKLRMKTLKRFFSSDLLIKAISK